MRYSKPHLPYDQQVRLLASRGLRVDSEAEAVQSMTMGCLIRLYWMARSIDARRIAHECGVKDQKVLFGWLKALNVLRNHCAHNGRVWNRSTVYPPDKINFQMVPERLHHLCSANTNKLYFLAAVLAHVLRELDPTSRFVSYFKTTMNKFPGVLDWTPEGTMGFVRGWAAQTLWAVP